MNIMRRNQFQTSMELVQITGEANGHSGRRVAFELLLAIAMSVGCWYTFFSMFPNPVDSVVSAVMIIALPIGLYLLCWNPFLGRFLVFYVFLLTAIFFVITYKSAWNGFLVMGNIMIEVLNDQMGTGLIPYEVTGDTVDWGRDAFLAMIPVMLLVSMAIVHSLYHKEPLLGFALTGLPVIVGLWLKIDPSVWLLLLLLLCWTGMFVLSAVARPDSRKKNRPIYIQNKGNSILPYMFLGITLVLLLGYVLLFSGDDYRPPQSVDEAKSAAIELQEHLRYDKLSGDEVDTLSRGDLTKTHPLAYTGNTVLRLEMQMPQSMYLRGFAGGDFEDGKWVPAAEGAYSGEYLGIAEWLAKHDFYPWMQQERLYRMSANYDFTSVDVANTNASSKYLYLPYEAAPIGDIRPEQVDYEKDYGAFAQGIRGQREYSFKAFLPRFQDYDEAGLANWLTEVKQSPDWNDYADAEAVYRRYVYDAYLYVSKEDADALGTTGIEKCQGKNIDFTLHYIRQNFDEEFEYNTEKEAAPEGKDELRYFLNDSRSGNDMHFATAAALMFRQAGIPARYVEGYYLSPQEIQGYTEMSNVTLDVLDSHAHSWVEVYVDEIGWFPVEVIPGFYDMEKKKTEEMEEDEKIEEEDKTNYQDEVPEMDQPEERQENEEEHLNAWWFVLAAILLAMVLYEYLGRQRVKKRLACFGTDCTEQQVYAMYRYLGKIMAFDKHPLPANPYEQLEEFAKVYDKEGEFSFVRLLRMVHQVRFGNQNITPEEHREMARYVKWAASQVYDRQKRVGKFLMKFILFYV